MSHSFILIQATSISAASTGNDRDASVMRGMLLWPVVGFDMFRAIDFYKVTLTVGIQDVCKMLRVEACYHYFFTACSNRPVIIDSFCIGAFS